MQEKILALAMGIVGVEEHQSALMEALCAASETTWAGRLKQGVAAQDCGDAFCCAAAFTAVADFVVSRGNSGVASFTAGEISVKGRDYTDEVALAAALRLTAERLMEPYAATERFAFQGVRG